MKIKYNFSKFNTNINQILFTLTSIGIDDDVHDDGSGGDAAFSGV